MSYLSPSIQTFRAFNLYLKRGNMSHVWDTNGNQYIDWLSQNLCISVGHKHPVVLQAAISQLNDIPHCTTMFNHELPELLAKELISTMKHNNLYRSDQSDQLDPDEYVAHFVNSGAEAIDLAVRMARVHTKKQGFIALKDSFHGLHGFAADVTEIEKFRQLKTNVNDIAFIDKNTNLVNKYNDVWFKLGGNIAGIIAEPIQGYGGVRPVENIKEMFEYVKSIGGVTICDEVQTGFGRTGTHFWGFQKFDIKPDIFVCAKGFTNGIGSLSAVVSRREIAESFSNKVFFNTYGCNPTACASALATLKVIKNDRLMDNCSEVSTKLVTGFEQLKSKYPKTISDVRGSGLLLGLELDKDKAKSIQTQLLEEGHIVGLGGKDGNIMRIQPPLSIYINDALTLIPALDRVIEATINI